MGFSKIESVVYELSSKIAQKRGSYIYDVEFVKEGGLYYLRVYVDRDGGTDLDECEAISRELSDELDKADPIKQNYYLEVSSPGIERKLKTKEHFDRYIGEKIDIGLYKAIDGSKQLTATLIGFDDGIITVEYNQSTLEISQKETTVVKLHFDF